MPESKRRTYIRGAAVLGATMVIAKILSLVFRLPINNILGDEGAGHFAITYQIYTVLLAVSTSGIPVALSRLISTAASTGRPQQVNRYFSTALISFTLIGIAVSLLMFFFAEQLALLLHDINAAPGIRVLSPAVLFVCVTSVYEGYGQGHNDMVPTSLKQIAEVLGKVLLGFAAAFWLYNNNYDSPVIAAGAIIGTPIGLCIALFLLIAHKRKTDRALPAHIVVYDKPDGRSATLKRILKVSAPITMSAAFMSVLTLIDTIVVRSRLHTGAGFPLETVDTLYGVYAKGQSLRSLPSVLVVPVAISIIPIITAALSNHRQRAAKAVTETSLKLTNVLSMPMALGMCVLAYPIFNVLYPGSNENGPACLSILGIASYFVCLQLMTTAILHANGQERPPMLSFIIGGTAQLVVDYLLVANPSVGIVGSPVGTLTCYFMVSVLNIFFIIKKVESRPEFSKTMLMPSLCSLVMAVAAKSVYELLYRATAGFLRTGYWRMAVCLFAAILIAAIVYAILVLATKTVTREEIKLLPKGERIADFLRMR
ncbi:MAG: polysaccharide biosynthesis protein [Clostridiales bacterium]|nr:polysaccharide biosynthesis protein [Clostridiales bacterium]